MTNEKIEAKEPETDRKEKFKKFLMKKMAKKTKEDHFQNEVNLLYSMRMMKCPRVASYNST